jgi:DNA-binding transcriptional MocR family regulator
MTDDLDTTVKLTIYRILAETALAPSSTEVAAATGLTESVVLEAFARLHARRLLVPEPGDPKRIRMAPPFSGIPTPFAVEARGKRYYANCVWDAYGIPAALGDDAVIPASDAFTKEPLTLQVRDGRPVPHPYVAHFAVPAARWWDNIIYT